MRLLVKRVRHEAIVPTRATTRSSGLDLYACLEASQTVMHGRRARISTGIAIEIEVVSADVSQNDSSNVFPLAWEAQIRPRSGLGLIHGVVAQFGTVDQDYRGELSVVLENHGDENFIVRHGDRIAQLVICSVAILTPVVVGELSVTGRGENGFGSTG
jgi:dUTP pyrophosphatase